MKTRTLLIFLVLISCLALPASPGSVPTEQKLPSTNRLPGVDLAEGISIITGVAISPLLGVGAVGAWSYWRTPPAQRSALPWFCQPWAWGTGLLLLAACFLKDAWGTAAPPLLKKPFDILELFENKLSALVASVAFVPFIAGQMAQHLSPPAAGHAFLTSTPFMAAALPGVSAAFAIYLVLLPLALAAFLIVWLASHMVHALIVISPHGILDAGLKLGRTAVLLALLACYLLSPYLAAALSLVVLFVAAIIAGFAFRLIVFGTFLACDLFVAGRAKQRAVVANAHAFLARRVAGVPVRTYGRIDLNAAGNVVFTYRPWLILPKRRVPLPTGDSAVSKGLLFPSLLYRGQDNAKFRCAAHFLPRYRGLEASVGNYLGATEIRDGRLLKGLKGMWAWLGEVVSAGRSPEEKARSLQLA